MSYLYAINKNKEYQKFDKFENYVKFQTVYDLLEDKVSFQGDMCLNSCPLLKACIFGNQKMSQHGAFSSLVVYRNDKCIEVFGA